MSWTAKKNKPARFEWRRQSIYSKLCRYARPRLIKVALLGILLVGLWIRTSNISPGRILAQASVPAHKTSFKLEGNTNPRESAVGKVHAVFGELNPTYERALRLHEAHSLQMGHPVFILRERILSGLWSKPAFVLATILQEMSKPEDVRLKWLLWVDADVVVMNPQIPLDVFIPPSPEFDYVNLLATGDRHGLNDGCFLIKIKDWSVKLLSGVISFHHFKPERYWRRAVVKVPQYWFNAYLPDQNEGHSLRPHEFRPGGLQIHFAGNRDGKRPEHMASWMNIAEQQLPEFRKPVEDTSLPDEIRKFWGHLSERRAAKGISAALASTEQVRKWLLKSMLQRMLKRIPKWGIKRKVKRTLKVS
ncbi:hypothetical protein F5882DRAFT_525098 [Hyaloscypha sp. PMI_1271]|nr:hypothetical protein F5882DRAFT_525098 [Hyaloscypha sp. PMI_1271]